MSQIDIQTVLQQLNCDINFNKNSKQFSLNQQLLKRQRACKVSDIPKHLLPPNYRVVSKKQNSLANVIKIKNNRLSTAAKQFLFGDFIETQEESIPVVELTELKIITQNKQTNFDLRNRQFKNKIHIKLKQNTIYSVGLKFMVHNNIVNGLNVVNNITRLFIRDQEHEVIGSFAQKKIEQEIELEERLVPQGFIYRGDYKGKLMLLDLDGNVHCQLSYKLTITKD